MISRITSIVLAFLLLLPIPAATSTPATACTTYATPATITAIDHAADLVTAETQSGQLYDFYGAQGRSTGDRLALIMNDPSTPDDPTDDTITAAYPIR